VLGDDALVNQQLEKIMVKAFADVYERAQKHRVDLRTGARIPWGASQKPA
jgi:glutamate dehydrogenase/leucine dehydrogenase